MACATLKRSLDWGEPGGLGGRPAKRRRCIPFCTSPTNRERASPSAPQINANASGTIKPKSPFPDVVSQKLTPEYMAENIKAEIRRLQRRKELQFSMENSDGSSSGGENSESPRSSEKPLFTFKQVGVICERMLREMESEIREEYDNVLTAKLSEQYDAFVKFTYDQIHKNYSAAPPSLVIRHEHIKGGAYLRKAGHDRGVSVPYFSNMDQPNPLRIQASSHVIYRKICLTQTHRQRKRCVILITSH